MIFPDSTELILDDIFLALPDLAPDREVFLKLECMNPAGSIKMKTALALIEDLEASGALHPGGKVIESSSGNLGIALAVGGSTGSVLAAVRRVCGTLDDGARIAVISPDSGEKYLRSVFHEDWVAERFY